MIYLIYRAAAGHRQRTGRHRDKCRQGGLIEGVMLKDKYSLYKAGREKGLGINGNVTRFMLIWTVYAQRGHGKRSSYYSDFTLGAWQGSAANPCCACL